MERGSKQGDLARGCIVIKARQWADVIPGQDTTCDEQSLACVVRYDVGRSCAECAQRDRFAMAFPSVPRLDDDMLLVGDRPPGEGVVIHLGERMHAPLGKSPELIG